MGNKHFVFDYKTRVDDVSRDRVIRHRRRALRLVAFLLSVGRIEVLGSTWPPQQCFSVFYVCRSTSFPYSLHLPSP